MPNQRNVESLTQAIDVSGQTDSLQLAGDLASYGVLSVASLTGEHLGELMRVARDVIAQKVSDNELRETLSRIAKGT